MKEFVEINEHEKETAIEFDTQFSTQQVREIEELERLLVSESIEPDVEPIVEPIVEAIVEPFDDQHPEINRTKIIRDKVLEFQDKNAEMMEKKHNKKRNKRTLEFEIADAVTVLIPRIDRGGSDMPRIPGLVKRVIGDKDQLYEIECKYGILNEKFRASDLDEYQGLLDFNLGDLENKISLREAARLASNRLIDLAEAQTICKCAGKCNGRCSCYSKKKNAHRIVILG